MNTRPLYAKRKKNGFFQKKKFQSSNKNEIHFSIKLDSVVHRLIVVFFCCCLLLYKMTNYRFYRKQSMFVNRLIVIRIESNEFLNETNHQSIIIPRKKILRIQWNELTNEWMVSFRGNKYFMFGPFCVFCNASLIGMAHIQRIFHRITNKILYKRMYCVGVCVCMANWTTSQYFTREKEKKNKPNLIKSNYEWMFVFYMCS